MKKIIKASLIMTCILVFCLSAIYAAPAFEVGPGWRLVFQGEINWPTNFMAFMNEKNGITIGANGECHYTEDGGKTWSRANNQSACRYGMDTLGESIAWSCGNAGNVRFTRDGGKNWDKMTDCGFLANFISFANLTYGWIGSPSMNKIVATSDGGSHWDPIDTPSQVNKMSGIASLSATSGYALVQEPEAAVLYLTEDGGKTWQKQSAVCQGILACPTVRFFNSVQGVIIGSKEGKMMGFTTNDCGKSWRTENIFSKICMPFLTRDSKTLTLMGFDNVYFVLTRK